MKIRILSDLHTEGYAFNYERLDEDVLVLAGDINVGVNTLRWITKHIPADLPVIFVPGNHCYYHNHFEQTNAMFRNNTVGTNINFLYNDEIVIDGVRFLGTPLWSNFQLRGIQDAYFSEQDSTRGINDFRVISTGSPSRTWTTTDSKNEFTKAEKFLKFKLHDPFDGKTVVVTHFTPTGKCVHPRWANSSITPYFSNNCDHLIGFSELWVCGHTHDSYDFILNDTRVVCNPKGYGPSDSAENKQFNPNLIVEI